MNVKILFGIFGVISALYQRQRIKNSSELQELIMRLMYMRSSYFTAPVSKKLKILEYKNPEITKIIVP